MSRTLSTTNQSGVAQPVTQPVYLIDLAYPTRIRMSSRETMSYESNSYTGTEMTVNLSGRTAAVRFFNEGLINGGIIVANGPGYPVTIYEAYGAGPFGAGEADVYFSGIVQSAKIDGKYCNMRLREQPPVMSPVHRVTDEIFHHLPPDGTQIQTRSGIYVLKRNI